MLKTSQTYGNICASDDLHSPTSLAAIEPLASHAHFSGVSSLSNYLKYQHALADIA